MSFHRLLVICGFLFLSPAAFSQSTSLLIEPYIGFHNADFKFTPTNDHTANGLTYGARLGMDYMGLQLGLDYMSGMWKDDRSPQDSITPGNFGVFLGYKFPAMIRIYGTYFFDEDYKFKASDGSNNYTGTEFRFGLGLTMLPLININLEYGTGTLTDGNGGALSSNCNVTYYGLTISVPLEF